MLNFPKEIAFHPHGIYIHQEKYVFVVNHAYDKGGERVDLFKLIETDGLSMEY